MTELGEQRRAADDDRIAFVLHQIGGGFFYALQLALEVGVHQLTNGSRAVEDHKTLGQHLIKFINQRIAPRGGNVTDFSAPTVHFLRPPQSVVQSSVQICKVNSEAVNDCSPLIRVDCINCSEHAVNVELPV